MKNRGEIGVKALKSVICEKKFHETAWFAAIVSWFYLFNGVGAVGL